MWAICLKDTPEGVPEDAPNSVTHGIHEELDYPLKGKLVSRMG